MTRLDLVDALVVAACSEACLQATVLHLISGLCCELMPVSQGLALNL